MNRWFYEWRRLVCATRMSAFAAWHAEADREQRRIDAGYCLDRCEWAHMLRRGE